MATSFSFSDGQSLAVVEAVSDGEVRRFNEYLAAEHYLGPRPPTGNTLRQVVTYGGEWVALLMWNAAARRLKPREAWIGWDAAKRSSRLKLVVQNSRFLVLSAHRQPNLASAALGAACQALPAQWRMRYGYAPVLAAWHGLSPAKALFFSFVACLRNWRVFILYGLTIMIAGVLVPGFVLGVMGSLFSDARLFTVALTLIVALVLAPTLYASFYVSYRDVFVAIDEDA